MPNLSIVSLSNLPLEPTGLILILIVVMITIFYLREYNKRKKLESDSDKFLQDIKQKGWETLNQSIKKSQNILEEAELEGIKTVAVNKIDMSKHEAEFMKQFSDTVRTSQQTIATAQNQLLNFMADLQKRSAEFEEASKKSGEQRINQLFDRLEERLSDFLVQTGQKATSSIELELKATREMIDTYKNQQFKLIDENIIAMMEQTLNIVLAKKLSLKDQLDLVYQALEKAKIEKFVV